MGHNLGLDSVRGIAVVLVVFAHATTATLGGDVGVTLFFALSGFLITSLLLSEQAKYGRVWFTGFYMRRALRLFPALLLMLAVTPLIMWAVSDPRLSQYPWWAVLTGLYLMDYARALGFPETPFGHTWSLAVEEQFYLVWPILLLALIVFAKNRPTVLARSVAAITGVALAWRVVAPFAIGPEWAKYALDTSAFALLIGCLLATRVAAGLRVPRGRWVVWTSLAGLALLTVSTAATNHPLLYQYAPIAAAVLALFFVSAIAQDPPRILTVRPLLWFGTISYSLYLWHFALLKIEYGGEEPQGMILRLLIAAASVGVAAASWYFLERPLSRRYRDRWKPSRSPENVARVSTPRSAAVGL